MTLVGLLGPALKSVSEVETADEVASVVSAVNTFLSSSTYIEKPAGAGSPAVSRFDAIYSAIQADEDYSTLFVYRWYQVVNLNGSDKIITRMEVGYEDDQAGNVNTDAVVNQTRAGSGAPAAAYSNAISKIYRVVLTASSAARSDPDDIISDNPTGNYSYYTLSKDVGNYKNDGKNHLALEVRIFVEDTNATPATRDLNALANEEPIFTYDTAILRN